MRVIIGGDTVPTKRNYKAFSDGDLESLIGEKLLQDLNAADLVILNLETPLVNEESPIKKAGPHLKAQVDSINALRKIKSLFFTLANNHIYDHGEKGLNSTVEILKKNHIPFSGVGNNLKEASKPYIYKTDDINLGIYCCAEHEFSIATETQSGANPFDPLESFDHIQALKHQCDFIIVLYHGGKEHYRYPSPQLQKICRKFIDKGANLVICQHSHCIGCEEDWNKGKIIYGQGNFLFDYMDNDFWKTSLLLDLEIKSNHFNIKYIPIIKRKECIRLADLKQKKDILSQFYLRSNQIKNPGFIQSEYQTFAKNMQWEYLSVFAGKITRNIFYRILNKLSNYKFSPWYLNKRYGMLQRIFIENYVECEAHRELLIQGIKSKVKSENLEYEEK